MVSVDIAFVYKDGKTLAIFPSNTEQKVAIVELTTSDLTSDAITISYVTFDENTFIPGRSPHDRFRQVEWAVGTNYVWVNDSSLKEIYIIDVMEKEVVTILKDFRSSYDKLISVQTTRGVLLLVSRT